MTDFSPVGSGKANYLSACSLQSKAEKELCDDTNVSAVKKTIKLSSDTDPVSPTSSLNNSEPISSSLVHPTTTSFALDASKDYPLSLLEAVNIGISNLKKTIVKIFGPDTKMFDCLSLILMLSGLKYVHYRNKDDIKTHTETQNEKLKETVTQIKEYAIQNHQNQNEKIKECLTQIKEYVVQNNQNQNEKIKESLTQIKEYATQNHQSQNEKLKETETQIKEYVVQNNQIQNEMVKQSVTQNEKNTDKNIANLKEDVNERLKEVATDQKTLSNNCEKLLLGLEKLFEEKIPRILTSFAIDATLQDETKRLQLQNDLLNKTNDLFNKEVNKGLLKSDKAYHDEQEIALRDAMDRYAENFGRKYAAIPNDHLQKATEKYKLNTRSEAKNLLGSSKSPQDESKMTDTEFSLAEKSFPNALVKVMEPKMRFVVPWIRRFRP